MNNIQIDLRLRPIRFGFLVRPTDKAKILEIFRLNTCLWGGMFNPIIPYFKRVPSWWERHGFRFENAKQIIDGYLDFFEPDFLVEAEEGLASELGFDSERVLHFENILEKPGEWSRDKHGLSTQDLYYELYKEDFRFESRHKRNVVHVKPKERNFTGFVAASFGNFPIQEKLRYFENNYTSVFEPEHISLDANALLKLFETPHISALRIGKAKLRASYHDHGDHSVFILNTKESKDLMDFWNLRAIYEHVTPIPLQWIEELSPFCKRLILEDRHIRYDQPRSGSFSVTFMFARSIPENYMEEICRDYLRVDEKGVKTRLAEYPNIWGKPSDKVARSTRPALEGDRKKIDVQIEWDNPEIRFDLLFPKFAYKYARRSRVANIVRLENWGNRDRIAAVFPCNYKNPTYPKFRIGRERLLPTTEGLVIFPKYKDIPEWWQLVDGTTAFNRWFNNSRVPATRSDAGRATQQIIETLGGSWGVGHIAHRGVIELLDEMTRSLTKASHCMEFQNKIGNAAKNERLKKRALETLVERKAVELGLELKCSKCNSWSWYSLKQLDYSHTCDLCRKNFDFPVINAVYGKHSRWAYRVVGPFALPNYADGGYAAALAIRFFTDIIGGFHQAKATWSSAQKLKLPSEKIVEVDFMLWYQREEHFETNYPTETVFGEAKSFGKDVFKQHDVDNMKLLVEEFPGAVLVFATMKDEFSPEELDRIKRLAQWGREYDREKRQSRAPVIVLTGTELFAEHSLENSWKEKGGVHKDFIGTGLGRTENLRRLADLTQELYLGMPSYHSAILAKMEKRKQKRMMADTATN